MDTKQLSGQELEDARARFYAINDAVQRAKEKHPENEYHYTDAFFAKNKEWGDAASLFAEEPTLDHFRNAMKLAQELIACCNQLQRHNAALFQRNNEKSTTNSKLKMDETETKELDAMMTRLNPQITRCVQTLKVWEKVHEKKHPDADQQITAHAFEEADDEKAKEWLDAYDKELDAEVTKEVHRRLHAMSTSVVEAAESRPGYLYHYSDELIAKSETWSAVCNLFLKERKLSHFHDVMRLGEELIDMYTTMQPRDVVEVSDCGDYVRVRTAPPKLN